SMTRNNAGPASCSLVARTLMPPWRGASRATRPVDVDPPNAVDAEGKKRHVLLGLRHLNHRHVPVIEDKPPPVQFRCENGMVFAQHDVAYDHQTKVLFVNSDSAQRSEFRDRIVLAVPCPAR